MSVLEVSNLKKVYTTRFGGNQVQALSNVNFTVEDGEYVAIMGESGSGKTTLLNILAALDRPTSGDVVVNGNRRSKYSRNQCRESPYRKPDGRQSHRHELNDKKQDDQYQPHRHKRI